MSNHTEIPSTDEARPDLTPMVDVVFQLLVFFLVSMKFKTLDQRIDAHLPKDKGPSPVVAEIAPAPELVARIARGRSNEARLFVQNRDVGPVAGPGAEASFARLGDTAERMRAAFAKEGGDPDEVIGRVDAAPDVETGHVLRAVDTLLGARVERVEFRGAPAIR